MNWMAFADAASAAIVVGGTALAAVMRCGWRDGLAAVRSVAHLWQPRFDAERTRAGLAVQVQDILRDGLLRAQPHHFGDAEFDEATDAMLERRSVGALLAAHESHRDRRLASSNRAVGFLAQAAELAPVFGLVGTLISLSQLPVDGLAQGAMTGGAMTGAISMAVVTTLYGLLLANLILAPLARMVERFAEAEEAGRQQLIDWLAGQIEASLPHPRKLATGGPDAA